MKNSEDDKRYSDAAARVREFICDELYELERELGEPAANTHAERVFMILNVTKRHLRTLYEDS